jgi:N-acetylglutamate synthase-like GNAT family acetyltransferase
MRISIRHAATADIPVLTALIDLSVRELQAQDYTPSQIDCALKTVYGVDTQLIDDQTYFVAECDESPSRSSEAIVGCGGWSKRKTLYGADHCAGREDTLLDPERDAAKIRAFFVHPAWVRRGVGGSILEACENAAKEAGFTRLEMGATLTGVPFYEKNGYVVLESIAVPMVNGESLAIIRMGKQF